MDQNENPDLEQLELPVNDYQEEDDEKLEPISITKIDTKRFLKNTVVSDINDHKHVEELIQTIVIGNKRKHETDSLGPKEKVPTFNNEATVSSASTSSNQKSGHNVARDHEYGSTWPLFELTNTCADVSTHEEWDEVKLNKQVETLMEREGKKYKLKLYLVETKLDSQFSKQFSKLATTESRERLCREKEVRKSYILFYYRNVMEKDRGIRAEIYALTTGSTWRIVSEYADKDFSKLVEKRTLDFPFKRVEHTQDHGVIHKETKTARTGHEIKLFSWDFLDKLIGNRTRSIRDNSSLFAKDIGAFRTSKGKHEPSKVEVREKSMKILRKLSISQLARVLDHFSKIFSHEKTFLVLEDGSRSKNEETDDQRFEMHDFMADVTDVQTIGNLNKYLHQLMEDSMNELDSNLYLIHENFDKWSNAEEVFLYAYPKNTTQRQKSRFELSNPPSLVDVMVCLRDKVDDKFKPEWLNDVNIKFGTTLAPLKKFIFSRFSAGDIGTYIYKHGKWIEIKAQYFYQIERDFLTVMSTQIMKQSELPQLLPWKHPGGKKEDGFKVVKFDETEMRPKWKTHFTSVCNNSNFDKVLGKVDSLSKGRTKLSFKLSFGQLEKKTLEERTAHLYRLLECNLNEGDYNAAHTLLNMILPDDCDTKVVTCDKKTPHGIELCDILIYNDTTTYLVHVKAGFDGGPIRQVCSQIRNAAENIFREQIISKGTGIIDKYWDELTKEADKSPTHENVVKRQLKKITKKKFKELFHITRTIIFVLACRDTRTTTDFTKDIPHSLDVPLSEKMNRSLTPQIIDDLKKKGYITDKDELTNKVILENKDKRVRAFKCMESVKTKKKAVAVDNVLISELPKSSSTIAKMEIIRLAHDFERYSIRNENIQLKLYNVEADFPDVN